QQLAGNHFQNRRQKLRSFWNVQDMVSSFADFLVAVSGDSDHRTRTSFYFLQVRQRLFIAQDRARVVLVVCGQNDNGQVLIDERVGSMLHLAGRITFGVDIGNFLQLQRTFQCDRIVHAASEKEKIVRAVVLLRQVFGFLVTSEQCLQLGGHARQLGQ